MGREVRKVLGEVGIQENTVKLYCMKKNETKNIKIIFNNSFLSGSKEIPLAPNSGN